MDSSHYVRIIVTGWDETDHGPNLVGFVGFDEAGDRVTFCVTKGYRFDRTVSASLRACGQQAVQIDGREILTRQPVA